MLLDVLEFISLNDELMALFLYVLENVMYIIYCAFHPTSGHTKIFLYFLLVNLFLLIY